jgi:hypothetical protein
MPVKHEFVYSWPTGVEPVYLHDWVDTLSEQEQKEFYIAQQRQIAYRSNVINEGKMYIDNDGSYVWSSEETAKENKPNDDTWLRYYNRYINETKTSITIKEIKC